MGGLQFIGRVGLETNSIGAILRDNSLTMHIGANENQVTKVSVSDASSKAIGINMIDLTTQESAEDAISVIDNAINMVSSSRSSLGATMNRLEHTIRSLGVTADNLTEAESRIRDADMAKEIMEYTKHSILAQVAQAMLAQANLMPQSILSLLQSVKIT